MRPSTDTLSLLVMKRHAWPLAADALGKLNIFVFWMGSVRSAEDKRRAPAYSDSLRMNRAEIRVFKQRCQIAFRRLLQSTDCGGLEA